jgi:hypothetical protein
MELDAISEAKSVNSDEDRSDESDLSEESIQVPIH